MSEEKTGAVETTTTPAQNINEGVQQSPAGYVERAELAVKRLDEALKRNEEVLARNEAVLARQILGGRTEAGMKQKSQEDVVKERAEARLKELGYGKR